MQSKKKNEQTGITALYCRLSRDDGGDGEYAAELGQGARGQIGFAYKARPEPDAREARPTRPTGPELVGSLLVPSAQTIAGHRQVVERVGGRPGRHQTFWFSCCVWHYGPSYPAVAHSPGDCGSVCVPNKRARSRIVCGFGHELLHVRRCICCAVNDYVSKSGLLEKQLPEK